MAIRRAVGGLALLVVSAAPAAAQQSADEIARALANPNTVLGTFNFPIDFVSYDGTLPDASGQTAFRLSAQPSLPYPLSPSVNFFLRPLVPVYLSQPVPTADGFVDRGIELGDIGFDVGLGKTFGGGLILVGGIVGSMPTATHGDLGSHQWRLGPEGLVAKIWDWGVLGLLVTQSWRIAGSDESDTSITGGQYFYTINLGGGWQISGQPTWSYDHNATDGNELTLPIGTGVARTVIWGSTPWKLGLQYWYYIESPEPFGPKHQVRLSIAPVLPLPW